MKKYGLFLLVTLITFCIRANNLRQINNHDGLSNSSISCLYQDSERFLWIGTYDGLNMYDSRDIYIYKPNINEPYSLSSNVIRNIIETENAYLWVSTKNGINKLSKRSKQVEAYYDDFGENSYMAKDGYDNLYILGKPGTLSLYSKQSKSFVDLAIHPDIDLNSASGMLIDADNTIWINHKGVLERYTVDNASGEHPSISRQSDFMHSHPILYCFYRDRQIVFIDSVYQLYTITAQGVRKIKDIHQLSTHGEIGDVIFDGQDILIAFKTNGLIRLNADADYGLETIDINCGVFSLWKDGAQDIIWIGTDGQGVYALTKGEFAFHNISLNELPINKKRPVRAIYADRHKSLWLGTKDNGIIRISNYDTAQSYDLSNTEHFTTQDGLNNNAVFALVPSRYYPLLWIGTDGPELNYYSYADNRIHQLVNHTLSDIAKVHAIAETCDSLLWVGSGSVLLRIHFIYKAGKMEAKSIRPIYFRIPNRQQYNQIYAIEAESDSILWVGMRGSGLIRLNTQTETHQVFSFDRYNVAPMNDILCILRDQSDNIWVGSSYGLTRLKRDPDTCQYDYTNFNEHEGLPNNTIHGIAFEKKEKLWMSTNNGLILFDTKDATSRYFNQHTGLKTIEFCDNAYYQDKICGRCFFGGVDGIVWIENEEYRQGNFTPQVYFTSLRIFNKDYSISDFDNDAGEPSIVLDHDQNFFAVSFVATDFINGENNSYSYKLEGFSNVWIDTYSNQAQFTNIPPGDYTLQVRYRDGNMYDNAPIKSIRITVRPPWYLSHLACAIYIFLVAGGVFYIIYYIRHKYELKRISITRKLDEKYKEEMYESKLRFFTNITHEFCTPLALIYGPCERLLQYNHCDSFIRKYVQIIKSNTERLNSLIQEIIDFRRMETGHKACYIQKLNITDLSKQLIANFEELAERNHIILNTDIEQGLIWNSDKNGVTKILVNLISNAFKYTPIGGTIRISICVHDDRLLIHVYNTGKGISQENIPLIFSRYGVLDNIKENSVKGLSSRNGLGLAIVQSLVELLRGTIRVESVVNQYAQFIVSLPNLEVSGHCEPALQNNPAPVSSSLVSTSVSTSLIASESDKCVGKRILIIDDNKELLWMLKDTLVEEFSVFTAENGEEGLRMLKQNLPDLIITDIMMPKIDGITLIKRLKSDKHTMHVPLVILSAKNTTDDKVVGIDSGADAYIPKPFSPTYLKSVIHRLLKKHEELKLYYNSSASAFDYCKGKVLANEDKLLVEKAAEIINAHIDDSGFGVEELAQAMQTSSRSLYRKFKEIDFPTPKDFIKDQRLSYATKLLTTTTLSIQEIMYQTGFNNRSHFYQEFAKRYEQTPKEYRNRHQQKNSIDDIDM